VNRQRLGRNHGQYRGETIDIEAVLRDCLAAAHRHGWRIHPLEAAPGVTLHTLHRPVTDQAPFSAPRIYLSTGIHGDEPAGPLAVRQLLAENAFPPGVELWVCPCLNPSGFPRNTRENAQGKDLNRDYLHLESAEVRAHIAWLQRQPDFHLALCLHEDWESHGFYLYELNPDNLPSLAEPMIEAVSRVCPVDLSPEIEGRPAHGGIVRPSSDPRSRPQWPEAFWLLTHKTRLSYTLEAPSDWPLPVRVEALVTAVKAAWAKTRQNSMG
jgi:murein peptide amidase A